MAELLPTAPSLMSFGLFSSQRALKGHFAHSPEHAVPRELSCLHPQAMCPCPALQWLGLAGRHRSQQGWCHSPSTDTDSPGSLQPFLGPCGWAGSCRWKHRMVTVAGHCSEQLERWQMAGGCCRWLSHHSLGICFLCGTGTAEVLGQHGGKRAVLWPSTSVPCRSSQGSTLHHARI